MNVTIKMCPYCGDVYEVEGRVTPRVQRYCDDTCRRAAGRARAVAAKDLRRIAIACATCGTSFQPRGNRTTRGTRRVRFCSVGCRKANDRVRTSEWTRARKYGLPAEELQRLFELQGGRCAICGGEYPLTGPDALHVDHDHRKGQVRNLLCRGCNTGLGAFREDRRILHTAIEYLTHYAEGAA